MTRDPQQLLTDEARIFCRTAVMAIKNEDWKAAALLLMERVKKLDMALQSLTPGGSEYVGEPARCVARARENLETYRTLWRDAVAKSADGEEGRSAFPANNPISRPNTRRLIEDVETVRGAE